MVTPLGRAVEFFREFGLFDIVLPFLLVFVIVFAVLEKTRILGVTKKKDQEDIPNKNLNAMVAFVVAMLVVAASNVVSVINEALPNVLLLLVVLVSFLILVGMFNKTGEMEFANDHGGYHKFFLFIIFIGIFLIFLGAIRNSNGVSWLEIFFNWVIQQWQGPVFTSMIILVVAVAAIVWLTKGSGRDTDTNTDSKNNGENK